MKATQEEESLSKCKEHCCSEPAVASKFEMPKEPFQEADFRRMLAEIQPIQGLRVAPSAESARATNTRPDIAFSVGMLCRAMSRPNAALLEAAERVLTYLIRNKEIGLRYAASSRPLYGMTDSDWAVRQSTSGWVFMFCSAAISWGSKRQPCVALSSCEAEIIAASEAAKEAVYLKRFASEMEVADDSPLPLHGDNQGSIDLAYNPEHHARTKHIDRRHFYIRETVENKEIVVPYVQSDANLADFFTKPLLAKKFFPMRNKIMNYACEPCPTAVKSCKQSG